MSDEFTQILRAAAGFTDPADAEQEPSIEEKARLICIDPASPERRDYPVHWNEEVAQAFLDTQQLLVDVTQQFQQQLADITREREGRILLQTALPLLEQMVANMASKDYTDRVQQQADYMTQASGGSSHYADPAAVLVNGALDLARGLLVGCGLKVK